MSERKYRAATWINVKTMNEVFAIEVWNGKLCGNKWTLCGEDKPYFFDNKEERDTKLKELKI